MVLRLAEIPWSFVMAFASLALVYYVYRANPALLQEIGMGTKEVILLALGSIAGWAVNVPVFIAGGTYIAVNMGGAIVPLIIVAWWVRRRKLRLLPTLIGTVAVSLVTWKIVEFNPGAGIITRYPYFFLPIVIAWGIALAFSFRRMPSGAPVAYAAGSIGALIGADILHLTEIRAHFATASESTIISIGGAGVFDMVFLAGTVAMALHLVLVHILGVRGRVKVVPRADYPGAPLSLRDSRRVWESYLQLEKPAPIDRALAGLALSDLALREGDFGRSVRMSWLAVDSLLKSDDVRAYLGRGVPGGLHEDVARLSGRYDATRSEKTSLREAGEANATARLILSALATRSGVHRLEGVA